MIPAPETSENLVTIENAAPRGVALSPALTELRRGSWVRGRLLGGARLPPVRLTKPGRDTATFGLDMEGVPGYV